MHYKYNFKPEYINSGLDIPDCYFKYNDKYFAVEVTSYFQQNSEQKHKSYVNDVQKYLKNNSFFEEVYHRLGRQKSENITITFDTVEEIKEMIINNIKIINYLKINNNEFINYGENEGIVFCIGTNKERMNIIEFIEWISDDLYNEKSIYLEIATKNRYDVSISFKYCKHAYYQDNYNKKAIPIYCWFLNEDELYNNIVNAIIRKNNKLLFEYFPKLKNHNVPFNYYNLVVYNEGIPAELDEKKLYNKILNIKNLKYDEIAIFLLEKIMIVNNNGYEIYNTKKF